MSSLRTLSAVVLLTFLLTVYLKQAAIDDDDDEEAPGGRRRGADGSSVKRIVAYSLEKQMEMQRKAIACDGSAQYADVTEVGDKLRVFSVHVDQRLHPYDYVRILAMVKGNFNETIFCNMHLKNGKTHAMKAIATEIWAENWVDEDASANYNPILISCQIPTRTTPNSLHLSKSPCAKSGTERRVFHNKIRPTRRGGAPKVTICVKPLNFQKDISKRLAKWMLMNQLLGADEIVIYVDAIHAKTLNFLKWYAGKNALINLKYEKPPNGTKLWQKRKNEILIYNHCFYTNLARADYILPIDIDELVIPKRATTWQDLIPSFPQGYASYLVRNAYYLLDAKRDDIFTTFQRTIFSDLGESGKSFVSTRDALTVFNHYALHALRPGVGRCNFLPEDLVQMNHYKETCPLDLLPECVKYLSSPRVYDGNILKYKKLFDMLYFNLTRYYKL